MDEIFKTRVESPQTPEIEPQAYLPVQSDKLSGNETKLVDEPSSEENKLEIWEGLNRRKYGHDYFDIRATAETFPIKAEFGAIDKFIKSEMQSREMEMTIQNYESLLREIEQEIGTSQTETYKRINKLFHYIQTIKKYREIKLKKEALKSYYW